MNAATTKLVVGGASVVGGFLLATVIQKKIEVKAPKYVNLVTYVGGFCLGAGTILLATEFLVTKSEAGAILAAG